jgi:hypothetical protein
MAHRFDAVAELTQLLREAGLVPRFDPRNSIMLCAVCGAHASRAPYRPFSIRLPWLGPSYSACSERCEWEAIGMRDHVGESD